MNCAWVFLYTGDAAAALPAFETSLRHDPRSRQIFLFGMAFANLFLHRRLMISFQTPVSSSRAIDAARPNVSRLAEHCGAS
jgi:hypothetical protein